MEAGRDTKGKYNVNEVVFDELMDEIVFEMNAGATLHPTWSTDPVHRASIIGEEAGEVLREANHITEGTGSKAALRKEVLHTAGVCFRMLLLMQDED